MKYTSQQHKSIRFSTYIHSKGPSYRVQRDFAPTPVYLDLGEYTESSYDKHTITTEIRPDYYIYTLERSLCLIINIIINIRYISRCVIQISKSVRFILHALSSDYRFSSVHVKNLPPTAL